MTSPTTPDLSDDAKIIAFCQFSFGAAARVEYGGHGARYRPSRRAKAAFDELLEAGLLTKETVSAGGRVQLKGTHAIAKFRQTIDQDWALENPGGLTLMEPIQ